MWHRNSTQSRPEFLNSSAPKDKPHGVSLSHFEEKVRGLAIQQDELMKIRESLLVQREDRLADKKAIWEQRMQTVDAEVALMSAFRKHFKQLDQPLPDRLITAYNAAGKQQEMLRSREEIHMEAEEDLSASEWTFADLETEFYQYKVDQILSDDISEMGIRPVKKDHVPKSNRDLGFQPSIQAQYQMLEHEYKQLSRRFDALRKQQALRIDTFTQSGDMSLVLAENIQLNHEAETLSDDLLGMIANHDVRLQRLRADLQLGPSAPITALRLASEPSGNHDRRLDDLTAYTSRSEGDLSSTGTDVLVDERIADWSLQSLKTSALEQLRYLNMLRSKIGVQTPETLDFELLKPLITDSWRTEDVNASASHVSRIWTNAPYLERRNEVNMEEVEPPGEQTIPNASSTPHFADMVTHIDGNHRDEEHLDPPLSSFATPPALRSTIPISEKVWRPDIEGCVTHEAHSFISTSICSDRRSEGYPLVDSFIPQRGRYPLTSKLPVNEPLHVTIPIPASIAFNETGNAKLDMRVVPWVLKGDMAVIMYHCNAMSFMLWSDLVHVTDDSGLSKNGSYVHVTSSEESFPSNMFSSALLNRDRTLYLRNDFTSPWRPQLSFVTRAMVYVLATSGLPLLLGNSYKGLCITTSREYKGRSFTKVSQDNSARWTLDFRAQLPVSEGLYVHVKIWGKWDKSFIKTEQHQERLRIPISGSEALGCAQDLSSICIPS